MIFRAFSLEEGKESTVGRICETGIGFKRGSSSDRVGESWMMGSGESTEEGDVTGAGRREGGRL